MRPLLSILRFFRTRYESLPESSGVNELVLQVLIIMLDLRVWTQALELYGPAPHRVYMRGYAWPSSTSLWTFPTFAVGCWLAVV